MRPESAGVVSAGRRDVKNASPGRSRDGIYTDVIDPVSEVAEEYSSVPLPILFDIVIDSTEPYSVISGGTYALLDFSDIVYVFNTIIYKNILW